MLMSISVFAAKKDVMIIDALENAGASNVHYVPGIASVTVEDIECTYSDTSKNYYCTMTDVQANRDSGARIVLKGEKAELMYYLLAGVSTNSKHVKPTVSMDTIRCTRLSSITYEGSLAERSGCKLGF